MCFPVPLFVMPSTTCNHASDALSLYQHTPLFPRALRLCTRVDPLRIPCSMYVSRWATTMSSLPAPSMAWRMSLAPLLHSSTCDLWPHYHIIRVCSLIIFFLAYYVFVYVTSKVYGRISLISPLRGTAIILLDCYCFPRLVMSGFTSENSVEVKKCKTKNADDKKQREEKRKSCSLRTNSEINYYLRQERGRE